jgi:hypothetical protein
MTDLGGFESEIQPSNSPRDQLVAELAARQHGVVARRQLVALGLGSGAIKHRMAIGRLHRVHLGVYAVGHQHLSLRGCWMGAVLAGGEGAVLSHIDAAALLDLARTASQRVHVTTERSRTGQPGIVFHRVRTLHPAERTVKDGIPVTTIARTLLDLAEVVPHRRLEGAFEAAERLELLDLSSLHAVFRRNVGRRGLKPLIALLAAHQEPAPLTRSELERRFVDLCHEADLSLPALNRIVAGLEVDAVWPEQKLVVELDGYAFHNTRRAFERDRAGPKTAGSRPRTAPRRSRR